MAELLKNRYNDAFFERCFVALKEVMPALDTRGLQADIYHAEWEQLELKARSKHIAHCVRKVLPAAWSDAADVLVSLVPVLHANHPGMELEYMFLPEIVSEFGLEDVHASSRAMEALTQYTTSEFAVRPFIAADLQGMMARMLEWSRHPHHGVRRWSSEGCRPLLPWGMVLQDLKKDPTPILPILDNLKNDPSEFVRRSVANNLNDISKNHPDLVLELTRKWQGISPETDALLKHANRTLLKAGHPTAMELFGFVPVDDLDVEIFEVLTPEVSFHGELRFAFRVINPRNEPVLLRVEYAMEYLRANGTHSRKVFKISEREVSPGVLEVERKQSFKPISTRRYYPGEHAVSLVLNGQDVARQTFMLLAD